MAALAACSLEAPGGTEVIVAVERLRLRSSTAEAAHIVGELKLGDRVTIKERSDESDAIWVRVVSENGVKGWTDLRNLIEVDTAERSQKIAEESKGIQAQAIGRSKASLKLRLSPDRSTEQNVLAMLPTGTQLEIVGRERRPRPDTAEQKENDDHAAMKFDEWYRVRLPGNLVTPGGWIYGGSVELEIPGDIVYYASTGRRIVGWLRLDGKELTDEAVGSPYLVLERQTYGTGEDRDFDRIKVLAYDENKRDYYTAFREDTGGRYPVGLKTSGRKGTFEYTGTKGHAAYEFEIPLTGRLKVTKK
jgi:hypothetical protein